MNSDLLDRGYSRRDIATVLSWSDLRDIIDHRKHDSALSRAIDPDGWFWNDVGAQLAAKSATALSSLRFWDLMRMEMLDEGTMADYLPAEYGPSQPEDSKPVETVDDRPRKRTVEEKRAIAERARQKAAGVEGPDGD
ncbi:hypothetical protein WKY82_09265 [Gordonia malaquae]|uniref:hypothetical protein n=1 Tax=Gordonia malaquae TaxID=410332 RepID=UPI0030C7952D